MATRRLAQAGFGQRTQYFTVRNEALAGAPLASQLHRWQKSQPTGTCAVPALYLSGQSTLLLAGDAFGGQRVEGVYLSGRAAAAVLLSAGT